MAAVPGVWEPATIRGELLQLGWGAEVGYPGIVVKKDGPVVDGFVFTSDALDEHWERLDDFEGDGYRRVLTTVELGDGRTVEAHIHVLRRPV